jgi:hypothetical protein
MAPFHRIQMWNGAFFEWWDILMHELTSELHHYPNNCPFFQPNAELQMIFEDISDDSDEFMDGYQPSDFSGPSTHHGSQSTLTMVSSTGIFRHSICWCHCTKLPDQYVQLLLCAKLFLASFKNPKTAFTFKVLDHLWVDALECKTAVMNSMSKIRRITDEAFPAWVPVGVPINQMIFSFLPYNTGPLLGTTVSG